MILSCFGAEMTAADKIRIIEEIVKQKKESGSLDRPEIYRQIAQRMPLDTVDTDETRRMERDLEKRVQEKYPETDAQLKKKFEDQALSLYRCYRVGDTVKISYYLYNKPYTISGRYYRSDASFVWIGSKKIAKSSLSPETAARFDSRQSEKARADYVAKKIRDYHQAKRDYSARLLRQDKNFAAYEPSRGKLLIQARWMTPREYADYVIGFYVLAEEAPREIEQALASSSAVRGISQLRKIWNRCKPYPELASKVREVLVAYEEDYIRKVINGISDSEDYQSVIGKLDRLIETCPEAKSRNLLISLRKECESQRKQEIAEREAQRRQESAMRMNDPFNRGSFGSARGRANKRALERFMNGEGLNPAPRGNSDSTARCGRCDGRGSISVFRPSGAAGINQRVSEVCPSCNGTGRISMF
ncbi:MAG: hypothetical protein J5806_10025 [Lentisphaeria bacterium]|nr:hypothetical protein [Lentisphaeria bacterium]